MKTILSFLVFLNLFNLSLEAIELPLFESASFSVTEKKEAQIYLNTSIYMIGEKINLSIKFWSEKSYDHFYCNLVFYDSLDFSKVYTQYSSSISKDYDYATEIYSYTVYYELTKPNKNRYLLFVFNKYHLTGKATIYHLNRPNSTSIELNAYSSLIVNSSAYVYQKNNYYDKKNIYFSFNFQNENKSLDQFEIYYGLDDYRDDKTFKHLNKKILVNPRLIGNNYSFYFEFELNNNKPYICLIPGKINNKIGIINITQISKETKYLKQERHLVVNSDDYVYFDTINILRSDFYFKIMLTKRNLSCLTLKYKYSNNYYSKDFVNMNSTEECNIYYKQIDDNKTNTTFYYHLKMDGSRGYRYILFQIPETNSQNFIFQQTNEDEYQKLQKEKSIRLTLIIIPSILMLATIVLITLSVIKAIQIKKMKNKNNMYNLNNNIEQNIVYEKENNSSYQEDNNYDTASAPGPFDSPNFKKIN